MKVSVMDNRRWWLRCAVAFASQLALLAVLLLADRVVYIEHDDTTNVAIACGAYGTPSPYIVNPHLILGYILKFLFTVCNEVNWYTVLLLTADMFGVLVLDMVFAMSKQKKASFFCVAVVLSLMLFIVLTDFTYTVTAYWAGIAGLIGLTYVFVERTEENHRCLIGIAAGISLGFGLLIRASTMQTLLIVYASLIVTALLRQKNWKPVLIALVVVCLMGIFIMSSIWMNGRNPIQKHYISWEAIRGSAVDCAVVPYDEEVFSERGITYNQYQAIYWQYYFDYDNVDIDTMETLIELNSPQNKYDLDVIGILKNHFSLWRDREQLMRFASLHRILFAAVLLFYLVFGRKKDYPFLFLTWGSTVSAEFVFHFIQRALYRIVMPGYLMGIVLIMLCCSIDFQKEQKLYSLNISIQKIAATLAVLLACASVSLYVWHGEYQAWLYSDTQRAVLDYLAENSDKVFLAGDASVYGIEVSDSIWSHLGKRGIWNLIGNWETYSVPYYELMERHGIQDPDHVLREAIDNDKILLLTRLADDFPVHLHWVLNLVEENYNIKAELEKVEDVSSTDVGNGYITYSVYKLVSKTE